MSKIVRWLLLLFVTLFIITFIYFQTENYKISENYKLTQPNDSFELVKKRFGEPSGIRSSDNVLFAKYYDYSFIISRTYYFKFRKKDSLLISKVID